MTAVQKIIKYAAITFGVFLIVSIGLGVLGMVNKPKDISKKELQTVELSGGTVNELRIELEAMKLVVETGDTFSAQTNNDDLFVSEKDEKLVFSEKTAVFNKTINGTLKITLPKDMVLSFVKIEMGAGVVVVQKLSAKRIDFDLGAGEVLIEELYVQNGAEIECGAGKFTIGKGEIHNLDIDFGVGKSTVNAKLYGNSEIDCGVGEVNLTLGKKSDYKIEINKGLGTVEVNGKTCNDFSVGGGVNKLSIDGGVGAIHLFFDEE
jgi:hypothetical protein